MADCQSTKVTGATKDYRFGPKNNWRRAVWNEVLRRTDGREKTHPILYLAGPQDLDRAVAIDKGVPTQNMIAVDLDQGNVDRVRSAGLPSIRGEILDVLWAWPNDRPVSAVMFDFCSGLTRDVAGVYDVFMRKPLRNAVVSVNFMRGRDAWSNKTREVLGRSGLLVPLWRLDRRSGQMECIHMDTKHRAYQFLMFHALDTVMSAMGFGSANAKDGVAQYTFPEPDREGRAEPEFAALCSLAYSGMSPKLFTYRSGLLTFDSAVFQPKWNSWEKAPLELQRAAEADIVEVSEKYSVPSLRRRIAAMLAVRTQRLSH